jgi:2-polyprenyl-3-methyl-5-hydroxy-6-metoxy-1,4-benzoquinol methylase
MQHNKTHWYDGWFYDTLIAPNQDKMFGQIKRLIKPGSKVIDVGCGTGRFSFVVADRVSQVTGVDLSEKNITKAKQNLAGKPDPKITFHHSPLTDLLKQNLHFDYAVMTYVIHEVDPEERLNLLKEMSQVADNIIIGDYRVPVQKGAWNLLNEVIEYFAGREHYNNYKHFVKNNGLTGLVHKSGLQISRQIDNKPYTSQILTLNN